jgi:DNA recombination-dependent growth factor C|nr:MAG TPA: putative exonuclease [Caudoviricetes sp.]
MKAFIPYQLTSDVEFGGLKANLKPIEPQGLASTVTYIAPHPCLYPDEAEDGVVVFGEDYKKVELHVVIRERVVPASSIRDFVNEKEKEYCKDTDAERAPRKLRQEWKEDYLVAKLPTAPLKTTVVPVLFLIDEGYVLIGTSSQKIADRVVGKLLLTLRNFSVRPFNTENFDSWLWEQVSSVDNGDVAGMVEYEDSVTGVRVRYSGDYELSEARIAIVKNPNNRVRSAMFDLVGSCTCVINDKAVVSQIKPEASKATTADKTVDDKRGKWYIDTQMCVDILKLLTKAKG